MSGIATTCDAGCKKQFTIDAFQHARLPEKIEKTYFVCPQCQHEYVSFYTDDEIRKLQHRLRIRMGSSAGSDRVEAMRQEIKVKMDALRAKVEDALVR